jgi:hypothetical protein
MYRSPTHLEHEGSHPLARARLGIPVGDAVLVLGHQVAVILQAEGRGCACVREQ